MATKAARLQRESGGQGEEAGNAAEVDLNKAWTKAEAASRKLQTVGADGWESAKTSLRSHPMNWRTLCTRIRPLDK